MIAITNDYKNAINASVRTIGAKVEVYQSGTLAATYTNKDAIKSITIERVGEDSKFFGFGVTHKANIKLRDIEREINLSTSNYFKIYIGTKLPDDTIEYIPFTKLFITEVNRDEKTNELSITAYDALNKAKSFTVNDLTLETSYTIKNVIEAIATKLGANASVPDLAVFETNYPEGANFEGSETLQSVLIAAAEATQTIYFMNGSDELVFKRLDKDGEAIKTLSNANYIELDSKTNKRLATICSATELGDNVSASKMEKSNNTINIDLGDIELCSIGDVKDELIVENRRAKIIKRIGKVVLNGSEDWTFNNRTSPNFGLVIENIGGSDVSTDFNSLMCNNLTTTNHQHSHSGTGDNTVAILGGTTHKIYIRIDETINTVSLLKTWLSTHNTTVYYELAAPEEIDFDISGYNLADGVYYGESTQETRSGKNKFNKETAIVGYYINLKTGGVAAGEGFTASDFIEVKPNTQYYCNFVAFASSTYGMAFYDENKNYISGTRTYNSIETPDNAKYFRFCFRNEDYSSGTYITDINIVQLEEGSTATEYEAYGISPSPDYPSEIVNKEEVDAYIAYPITGTTQYVRDNPFWELREDIKELLETAADTIGGMTINQFECEWRGDLAVEIGDKLALITKDNKTFNSYLLNDSISYNGALEQKTEWQYNNSEETESNPSTLGEALKQTYARVDKANKQIDLIVSETDVNRSEISNLQISTNAISASVQEDINDLTNKVNAAMTAEEVNIAIKNELDNGVSKVETTTGFKFDENGLTISKTGSEMETNVDEDGLSVYRDDEEVLTADNEGVKAYNLHAKTYLIIGATSRFEDYEKDGEARTGCFWIGGAE